MRTGKAVLLITLAACITFVVVTVAEGADAATYGANLTYEESENVKIALGANPVLFNFTINHTGDNFTQETVIDLKDKPSTWQHFLTATTPSGTTISTDTLDVLFYRGEVAITPPPGERSGWYWMEVNVYPRKDPSQNESYRICVVIPGKSGFMLFVWNPPPDEVYRAIPPSTVTIRFALYNTGNGVDRFHIQGESSRIGEGWTFSFVEGIDEHGYTPNLTADPGKVNPHFIDAKVFIPAKTHANEEATIVANATSLFNVSKQMPSAFAIVQALQYYNFQVFIAGVDEREAAYRGTVTFEAMIRNLGNGPDEFTMRSVFDEELNPGFIARIEPSSITIEPYGSGTFTYLVTVPEDVPKKTFFFTVEIRSSSPELVPVTKSFSVAIGQIFSLIVSCDKDSQTTVRGGKLDYDLVVTNTGNGLDNVIIDVEGVPTGWLMYIQPPELVLLPGKNQSVSIRVIVPTTFEEAPEMEYTMTVVASSSRSVTEISLEIHIGVEQFNRIELTLRGEPLTDPARTVAPEGAYAPRPVIDLVNGSTAVIGVGVKNMGNGPDPTIMGIFAEDDRITFDHMSLTIGLERGQESDIYWIASVPDSMPGGLYRIWVHANSKDPLQVTRSVPIDLEVVPLFDEGDFSLLTYFDPAGDDYTFSFETDEHMGWLEWSMGAIGDVPAVDIVSLDVMLDTEKADVILTMVFSGAISDDGKAEYWVYFVNATHRQGGVILNPQDYEGGDYSWDYSDEDDVLLSLFLDDGVARSGSGEPFDTQVSGNRVVITIPARRLRGEGLEPGSIFGVYAYAHVLDISSEDGWSMTVTWDSAGVGAAGAPEGFDNRPEEGSPIGTFLAPLAIAVATVTAVLRRYERVPQR